MFNFLVKLFVIFFSTSFLFLSPSALAVPFTIINWDLWKEIPPANARVNFYDELFLDTIPRVWNNVSPHGGNLGTKIEAEIMIWEGKDFCGYVSYYRLFDPDWAGDTYVLGAKLDNLFEQSTNVKKSPTYSEKCALIDPNSPRAGMSKGFNNRIKNIGKKKGMKGNKEAVRTQRFDYTNPDLKCMFFAGGLGPSKWTMYYGSLYLAEIWAHLCVKDSSYFTAKKIKQLARSLGIETDDSVSTKLKGDPPEDLKIDLSKFTEVTGKRDNYSIGSEQVGDSQNQQTDSIKVINKKTKCKKLSGEIYETNRGYCHTTETVVIDSEASLQPTKDSSKNLEKKLIKLKDLFEKKLISKEEYESEKKEILNQF